MSINTTTHVATGLALTMVFGVGIAVSVKVIPVLGGMLCMGIAALLSIVGLVRGRRLPLHFRVFVTGVVFYNCYTMCLFGRTMEPGLTRYTVSTALYCAMFALMPSLSVIHLWSARLAFSLLALLLPVSFGAAAVVAGVEEQSFIRKYRDIGVGPTARWTVPHHWLSYDRETQRLDGSD